MKAKLNVLMISEDKHTIKSPFAILDTDEFITVNAVTSNSKKVLNKIREFQPDVVIFSASIYDMAFFKHVNLVKETLPDVKTMLLMSTYDKRLIIEGLVGGIDGFLLNDRGSDTRRLTDSIHDLYQEGYLISRDILRRIVHQFKEQENKKQLKRSLQKVDIKVTSRELDTLYLLMRHYSNQEIASLFGVKEKSVREYVSNAYSKIGIHKRDKAIVFLQNISHSKMGHSTE